MKRILLVLIRIYSTVISPFLPATCRFYPTCSAYAAQAVHSHGVVRGVYLALRRIVRCHPLYRGDYYDPVPETKAKRD